jgi:hypothetical protein
MKSLGIIASTLGIDQNELSDYRYQPTRTKQPIYAIGNFYFACGKKKPGDWVGADWVIDKDQFFAEINKTILWSSKAV